MLRSVFWASAGALAWTHAGYPLAAALLARLRTRPVRCGDGTPTVTVIVAAHDEEAVIGRRIANLLELDYPPDNLEIVVASDGSTDGTDTIVEAAAARDRRVWLVRCPRRGKYAALDEAVRGATSELLAFSDANTLWCPETLRALVGSFADPDVGYACGQLRLRPATGTNREGLYWRYELWLRAKEAAFGSITGGNGAVYAVRRLDYLTHVLDHDIALPHLMVKRGRRAVYVPDALAFENQAGDLEHEYARKARMFAFDWRELVERGMLRGVPRLYLLQLVSHRALRYGSGLLHVAVLTSSAGLAGRSRLHRGALSAQLVWLALAGAGRKRLPLPGANLAYYSLLVELATIAGLVRYVRSDLSTVWEAAPGTR